MERSRVRLRAPVDHGRVRTATLVLMRKLLGVLIVAPWIMVNVVVPCDDPRRQFSVTDMTVVPHGIRCFYVETRYATMEDCEIWGGYVERCRQDLCPVPEPEPEP